MTEYESYGFTFLKVPVVHLKRATAFHLHMIIPHYLFIMRRFDLYENGERYGLEDFSVLLGERAQDKYMGSYESLAKVISMYCASPQKDMESFFRLLVLSVAVGNGDAHKKNFSLLYDDVQRPETIRLAPAYDIVCTLPYLKDDTPALKMNGHKKHFAKEKELIRFGKRIGVQQADEVIHQVLDSVSDTLKKFSDLLQNYQAIRKALQQAMSRCISN